MFHVTPKTRARLKALSKTLNTAIKDRDSAICDARNEGGSLREIADLVGLSHTEVRRIVNKAKGATP